LTPKLDVTLDRHIKANLTKYLLGSIQEIDIRPITHRPRRVTRYGMKGLERNQFSIDDVLIFPRTIGELPTNGSKTWTRKRSKPADVQGTHRRN
jgi:hypothetical protein